MKSKLTALEIEQQYLQLKARFRSGLPQRKAELALAWAACLAPQQTPPTSNHTPRSAFSHLLHRLAGAAGAYGFDRLGQQAKELAQQVLDTKVALPTLTIHVTMLIETISSLATPSNSPIEAMDKENFALGAATPPKDAP